MREWWFDGLGDVVFVFMYMIVCVYMVVFDAPLLFLWKGKDADYERDDESHGATDDWGGGEGVVDGGWDVEWTDGIGVCEYGVESEEAGV